MRSWQTAAGLAALAVAVQFYGVYRPTGPPVPLWFPNADKVEHAVGFGLPVALILGALTLRAQQGGRSLGPRAPAVVVAIFGAHAVVSEVIQHFSYRYRTGDPFDVLADFTGVALGAGFHSLVLHRSRPRVRR